MHIFVAIAFWIAIAMVRVLLRTNIPDSVTQSGKVEGDRGPAMRSFSGRAGRWEWWRVSLWSWLIVCALCTLSTFGPALAAPWILACLAVNQRRLHDLSAPGWLQIAPAGPLLVYYASFIFVLVTRPAALAAAPALATDAFDFALAAAPYALFCLALGLWPGANGANAYGEADASLDWRFSIGRFFGQLQTR